jgi:hypothetical protein
LAWEGAAVLGVSSQHLANSYRLSLPRKRQSKRAARATESNVTLRHEVTTAATRDKATPPQSPPIVVLSRFQTPAWNKAFQPFWPGEAHEMAGVLDDN